MRRGNNNGTLTNTAGEFMGICLGADYCAEHEWGIKELKRTFGIKVGNITKRNAGIKRHVMTTVPNSIIFFESERAAVLLCSDSVLYNADEMSLDYIVENCLREKYDDTFYTGWSERDFGIYVTTKDDIDNLRELWNQIQKKNVGFWIGGSQVFQNGGLNIVIIDKVDEENVKQMKDNDLDHIALYEASDATGIIKRLEAKQATGDSWPKPCGYMACQPAWIKDFNEERQAQTQYDVIYWLNPEGQWCTNFGWFTVEELDQWIAGEGPIPKKEGE